MLRRSGGQTCYFCNRCPRCCVKRHQTQSRRRSQSPGVYLFPTLHHPPAKRPQPQASLASARATSRRTNQRTPPGTVTAPSAHPALWGPASPAGGAESAPPAGPSPRAASSPLGELGASQSSLRSGCGDHRRGHSGRRSALPVLCFQVRAAVSPQGRWVEFQRDCPSHPGGPRPGAAARGRGRAQSIPAGRPIRTAGP